MSASKILFNGFLIVYDDREENEQDGEIPTFEKDDVLNLKKLIPSQHFTQPPPRYSEASLVKVLEEKGIGRPSTYAPIISKIQTKAYIEKIDKALKPTLLGKTVMELAEMLDGFDFDAAFAELFSWCQAAFKRIDRIHK